MMTAKAAASHVREICELAPIIPVLVVDDAVHAKTLAEALIMGGLPVLEVTLRTPVAFDVIAEMASVPDGVVDRLLQRQTDREGGAFLETQVLHFRENIGGNLSGRLQVRRYHHGLRQGCTRGRALGRSSSSPRPPRPRRGRH